MNGKTDLSIKIDSVLLNIRVAVLIHTQKGYIFEQCTSGYFFPVGGRVKTGEPTEDAARREVFEELGLTMPQCKLNAVVENFFISDSRVPFHELCFFINVNMGKSLLSRKTFTPLRRMKYGEEMSVPG
ncbi:NUDIX domain-containing protein [Brucepastera parasyntrophica]|uniref:NUDIX domain-containing protein n=1 Tax=Brucepastera parasyntrophica TaxID=2880008 RepID=UPI00210DC823|nr:NUDIX domain-containing protein [Brucepastera parasyntrophica]ULQ59592.1 NUDIX domain-containing protein [Brucepastera parasyntrophica]